MRILALTNLYPNPWQPLRATFNRQQFRALATGGEHEVQVIAPIAWAGEWSARGRTTASEDLPEDRKRLYDGMVIHHPRYLYTPKILRGWYGRFFIESVRACFRGVVEQFRPDIVLGCWAYPDGWAAVQLAREADLPVAIKVHGSDLLTIDDQPAKKRATSDALRSCDAVIAVSRNLKERAVQLGADRAKVHIVYNGVDTNLFCPGSREEAARHVGLTSTDPLILFVGNLAPVKGLDVFLDSLATLKRDDRRFQCVLVGEGPLRASLESRIESLGLRGQVRLAGAMPPAQLPHWYRAADLFVLPSRSEGVPNVLLEAMACGTPCIASHVGGIPEIAPAQSLVPAGDSSALASSIARALASGNRQATSGVSTPGNWSASAHALANVLQAAVTASTSRMARAA